MTEKKVAAELGHCSNIHILHADLMKHASLKQAAADTAPIIGEQGIDYLVANGVFVSLLDNYGPIGDLYVAHPFPSWVYPNLICIELN